MRILTALFFAVSVMAAAQTPQVPHKMEFAGMSLTIRDDARREIQKDVDALTLSPRHFNIKAERAKTYFPIIEKVFADEGVPDDFKYLVLQESALIPDAVSSSNAVGFWQFKDFTAIEMGLRVDREIDERMNIASATRGAAKYIKKNNTFFDNWLYALQAYQMGAGAVMRSENDTHGGEKHAEITSGTYWYVKKFLAHKIAYEGVVEGPAELVVTVYENNKTQKNVADLCSEFSVPEDEFRSYNKWVKGNRIPDDRVYIVLIPGAAGVSFETLPSVVAASKVQIVKQDEVKVNSTPVAETALLVRINGVKVIQARQGDNAIKLAERVNVDLIDFLNWNDMDQSMAVVPGTFYFLGKKRNKATEAYHTVAAGENLWIISQKHGVKLKKLKRYNRMTEDLSLKTGSTVWLSSVKPKEQEQIVSSPGSVGVLDSETIAWDETPPKDTTRAVEVRQDPAPVSVVQKADTVLTTDSVDSNETLQLTQETAITKDSAQVAVIEIVPINRNEHIVQPKETLYAIAKIYNVGVMDLVNWNNLDLQQGIKIGQVLKVRAPQVAVEARKSADIVHEVGASDTLYSIARKYGVTIKDLMEWNEKKDFSISAGEKLKIKQLQ